MYMWWYAGRFSLSMSPTVLSSTMPLCTAAIEVSALLHANAVHAV